MSRPLVAHYLDSGSFGGTEQAALSLLRALRDRYDLRLLLHPDAPSDLRAGADEAGLVVLTVPRAPAGLQGVVTCRRVLRRLAPAIFHAQRAWPIDAEPWLFAARLAGVTGVVTTEQLFPDRLPRRGVLRERLLDPWLHVRVAVSEHVAARVRETFGTPARRLRVVHNGIDPAVHRASPAARRPRPRDGGAVVLAVAHLRPQKGLDVLVDAAARVPEARFVVAGEGPERGRLEARIAERDLGERLCLLGARTDVAQLLAACDVFVLPSRYEGLPLALLEAMAARAPVVATRVGGVPEALDDTCGRLVPPGDSAALASAISETLADPDGAARAAERAAARVEAHFTIGRTASAIAAIYEELLA